MRNFFPVLRRRNDWMDVPGWKLFDTFFEDFRFPKTEDDALYMPTLDVSETDDLVIVRAEAPGMDKKDIKVTLSEGILTISGEKRQKKAGKIEELFKDV